MRWSYSRNSGSDVINAAFRFGGYRPTVAIGDGRTSQPHRADQQGYFLKAAAPIKGRIRPTSKGPARAARPPCARVKGVGRRSRSAPAPNRLVVSELGPTSREIKTGFHSSRPHGLQGAAQYRWENRPTDRNRLTTRGGWAPSCRWTVYKNTPRRFETGMGYRRCAKIGAGKYNPPLPSM